MDVKVNDSWEKFKFIPRIEDDTYLLKPLYKIKFDGDKKYDVLVEKMIQKLESSRYTSGLEITDLKIAINCFWDRINLKLKEFTDKKIDSSYFNVDARVAAYKQ